MSRKSRFIIALEDLGGKATVTEIRNLLNQRGHKWYMNHYVWVNMTHKRYNHQVRFLGNSTFELINHRSSNR